MNKRKGGYTGLTFPDGHLEPGETICDSVIREGKEEAGLDITDPLFCGIYHWYEGDVHHHPDFAKCFCICHSRLYQNDLLSRRSLL